MFVQLIFKSSRRDTSICLFVSTGQFCHCCLIDNTFGLATAPNWAALGTPDTEYSFYLRNALIEKQLTLSAMGGVGPRLAWNGGSI